MTYDQPLIDRRSMRPRALVEIMFREANENVLALSNSFERGRRRKGSSVREFLILFGYESSDKSAKVRN